MQRVREETRLKSIRKLLHQVHRGIHSELSHKQQQWNKHIRYEAKWENEEFLCQSEPQCWSRYPHARTPKKPELRSHTSISYIMYARGGLPDSLINGVIKLYSVCQQPISSVSTQSFKHHFFKNNSSSRSTFGLYRSFQHPLCNSLTHLWSNGNGHFSYFYKFCFWVSTKILMTPQDHRRSNKRMDWRRMER